ncbi:histidine phosphatase family protein [Alkalihalobacterium bogoriense]|uniref:histidine phosphatase family protein n=1 Tax=Alkalihalobacterium bogoriense TaxID=246272 RepID=UPI00047B0637|nr:histidine phosphatase family protein [Alkalihalobacterium bogoriense]
MKLYLIRHGESMGNVNGIIQGHSDFPLSPKGRIQAENLANSFSTILLDYIYSSDLTRAFDTAQAIANKKSLPVQQWDTVREIGLGPFEQKSTEEIYTMYPFIKERSILTSGVEGTETIEAITQRCHTVWNQMLLEHQNENVAIVSHGGFISIFIMFILAGDSWHEFHRPFQIGNTSVSLVEQKEGKKPSFVYINDTSHLRKLDEIL